MYVKRKSGPHIVELKDGTMMSRADLPNPRTRRWVASRKAAVVNAVDAGLISDEEACKLYDLSDEELDSWRLAMAEHGAKALKTTAIQKFR